MGIARFFQATEVRAFSSEEIDLLFVTIDYVIQKKCAFEMVKSLGDNFALVHKLTKNQKFYEAIAALVNPRTGTINEQFAWHKNHAWYCVADSYFKLGDLRAALHAFKKACKADPQDVESYLAIGNCYDGLNKPRLAERFLRKALLLNPMGQSKAAVLLNLGNSLFDQNRWSEAIECYAVLSKRADIIGKSARKNSALAKRNLNS